MNNMMRPSMTLLRAGRVLTTSQAPATPRMFSTSSHLRTDISSSALPKQKPVGAFRGGYIYLFISDLLKVKLTVMEQIVRLLARLCRRWRVRVLLRAQGVQSLK